MENSLSKYFFIVSGHRNGSHVQSVLLGYPFMQGFEGRSGEDKIPSQDLLTGCLIWKIAVQAVSLHLGVVQTVSSPSHLLQSGENCC